MLVNLYDKKNVKSEVLDTLYSFVLAEDLSYEGLFIVLLQQFLQNEKRDEEKCDALLQELMERKKML